MHGHPVEVVAETWLHEDFPCNDHIITYPILEQIRSQ